MHVCCEASRSAARAIVAEVDVRVRRGEREGFTAKDRAIIELLRGRLANGFCKTHSPIPPVHEMKEE